MISTDEFNELLEFMGSSMRVVHFEPMHPSHFMPFVEYVRKQKEPYDLVHKVASRLKEHELNICDDAPVGY